jgi:amino acid adenylation domain-containing protein
VRAEGLTLNILLQAAWALLLARYSGESDVVFGTTVSGRSALADRMESMVGLFINTVPVRVEIHQDAPVLSLLNDLQVRQAERMPYEHSPLALVQGESEIGRGQALFDSILVVENYPVDAALPAGSVPFTITGARALEQTNYPLAVVAIPGPELLLSINYAADRFDDASVARMLGHMEALLEGVAADPKRRVSELPLLSAAERRDLLVGWNDTRAETSKGACVHTLFEAAVLRRPEAVAVVAGQEALTYGELNRRANQLARRLRSLGVGPGVLVGVCVERSLAMAVGLLGVLKGGGAYVPLDPSYPKERLEFMMADAELPVLLTQSSLLPRLPSSSATVLCLDAGFEAPDAQHDENPAGGAGPEHPAYVIYTSGSTGRPKGVVGRHACLSNLVSWHQGVYGVTAEDRATQLASFSFDASVWEVWPYLTKGASLYIVPDDLRADPRLLATWLCDNEISISFAPTPLGEALLDQRWPRETKLCALLVGGDRLKRRPPADLPFALINHYGPTESTVVATSYRVAPEGEEAISIGRPIANTRAYVLDDALQPQPIGVPGELYLGGDGLAQGYLNRPELSAARFIPSPFAEEPGERLYRTGDLCRWLEGGTLEYLGRTDDQVKIRGIRIELGEIESVLSQHAGVREAVVVAREDAPGHQRLVAYLTARESPPPEAAELVRDLSRKLPDAMIPTAFVWLAALPLTPNGKVDRKALPHPEATRPEQDRPLVDPRDAVELELVQILEDLLAVRPVGVLDDFFSLGGNSLLAIRLMARIQERFGQALSLAALFQGATVEALALRLRQDATPISWSPLVAIQPSGPGRPFFCVHPLGGAVLCYTRLARHLGADRPFYGLQAQGLETGQEPLARIEDLAAQYIGALRAVQPKGPYLLGGWSLGGLLAFEMAQQLVAAGELVALLALFDTEAPSSAAPLHPEADEAFLLAEVARGLGVPISDDELSALGPEERLQKVTSRLASAADVVSPGLDLRRYARTAKAHLEAVQRYAPRPYPGRIVLARAAEAMAKAPAESEGQDPARDLLSRWSHHATEPVELHDVPGNHFTMVVGPHAGDLAAWLKQLLLAADPSRG